MALQYLLPKRASTLEQALQFMGKVLGPILKYADGSSFMSPPWALLHAVQVEYEDEPKQRELRLAGHASRLNHRDSLSGKTPFAPETRSSTIATETLPIRRSASKRRPP